MKKNCWEIMKCGREPGGKNEKELGVCPAAIEVKANGIHSGKNGGRSCWAIAGTMCEGKVEGSFAQKFDTCMNCKFYKQVTEEEDHYLTSSEIIKKINFTWLFFLINLYFFTRNFIYFSPNFL